MAQDNGGPAFPNQAPAWAACPRCGTDVSRVGMSLRDWFAGQAMMSIFTGPGARMVADRDQRYNGDNWSEVVAQNAYEMADAMLAHRSK